MFATSWLLDSSSDVSRSFSTQVTKTFLNFLNLTFLWSLFESFLSLEHSILMCLGFLHSNQMIGSLFCSSSFPNDRKLTFLKYFVESSSEESHILITFIIIFDFIIVLWWWSLVGNFPLFLAFVTFFIALQNDLVYHERFKQFIKDPFLWGILFL